MRRFRHGGTAARQASIVDYLEELNELREPVVVLSVFLRRISSQMLSFNFFLEILLGLLLLPSCCPQNVPFHIAHNESRLQCVDSGHQRLESEIDHPKHGSQDDGRDNDEDGGALQLRPRRPSRLLGELGERLFAVIDKLSHLHI